MAAAYLLLAALIFRSCLGAEDNKGPSPSFSPDSIVNSANNSSASLTPNGLATVFGSHLAESTASVGDVGASELPTSLAGIRISIEGIFVSLLYVSPSQINFLIPSNLKPGNVTLRLIKQGLALDARIKLLDAAPALFAVADRVTATHADGSSISPDAPARPGEIIVVYCAGLGRTNPLQLYGMIPRSAASILLLDGLRVLLDGQPVPSENILYAGITPGYAGLYQVNLRLPEMVTKDNPELVVALGDQTSQSALILHVATAAQPGADAP